MAKPNFQFEKRQKELAKKQKKEEKRLRKQHQADAPDRDGPDTAESGEKNPAE